MQAGLVESSQHLYQAKSIILPMINFEIASAKDNPPNISASLKRFNVAVNQLRYG